MNRFGYLMRKMIWLLQYRDIPYYDTFHEKRSRCGFLGSIAHHGYFQICVQLDDHHIHHQIQIFTSLSSLESQDSSRARTMTSLGNVAAIMSSENFIQVPDVYHLYFLLLKLLRVKGAIFRAWGDGKTDLTAGVLILSAGLKAWWLILMFVELLIRAGAFYVELWLFQFHHDSRVPDLRS